MQPAPSEVFQNATLIEAPQSPSPSTQHGLPVNVLQASGGTLSPSSPGAPSSVSDDNDSISVASGETHRGRNSHVGRLSSRDDSSQGGSPGTRIDEYEKAHATQRKRSDGMIFQIVPMAKGKAQSISIESFPNGAAENIPFIEYD